MSRGTIDDFCTQVCRCVRFWPDHKAITAELTAHLEDHAAALEARGLSPSGRWIPQKPFLPGVLPLRIPGRTTRSDTNTRWL